MRHVEIFEFEAGHHVLRHVRFLPMYATVSHHATRAYAHSVVVPCARLRDFLRRRNVMRGSGFERMSGRGGNCGFGGGSCGFGSGDIAVCGLNNRKSKD